MSLNSRYRTLPGTLESLRQAIQIDTEFKDFIVVLYEEQLYWKNFNVFETVLKGAIKLLDALDRHFLTTGAEAERSSE